MRVMVYWNTHKKTWSLMDPRSRRIVRHADELHLVNATTKVSEAGRQRVIRTGAKCVHAFVIGDITDAPHGGLPNELRYNPHETALFVDRLTGEPVHVASAVTMHKDRRVTYKP